MIHRKGLNIGLFITVLCCFFFYSHSVEAQKVKKPKKKKEVSILKKAWGDVNTRNNYYFNAKMIYDELLKYHEQNADINFQDTLPYYFHDVEPWLSSREHDLQQIIIKTGIVLQKHDYSRWKDDCYTLLGKAYFLRGDIDSALANFQYVSTALRGNFNDTKVAVSQKEILKAKVEKQKELAKLAKGKKKEQEAKAKAKKQETAKAAEDKKKRMEATKKAKEKELKRKIKAKEKMLRQKAKGKYRPPAPSVTKKEPTPKKERDKKGGNILDKISQGISVDFDKGGDENKLSKAEQKIRALERKKEHLEAANVEDSLTQKQLENRHKLTLWEKIKHLQSRPEALVWMAKSYIKLGELQNAESIVEYSKTLVKLRKGQIKDINLVSSYYYYTIGHYTKAAEELRAAIPYIKKKKERHYYNYLLAQLISNENPEEAYVLYEHIYQKAKDEKISFNALESMYHFAESGKAGTEHLDDLYQYYKKLVKSKIVGDQALFTLAEIALKQSDTTTAIENLEKALTYSFSSPDQKGKTLSKLGDIAYQQFLFKDAYYHYDSARVLISKDTVLKARLETQVQALEYIVVQQNLAYQQDSLIYLSTLSRSELAEYIREQNRIDRKERRRNAIKGSSTGTFTSQGMGNNANFDNSQNQFTSKGKWYFYNIDMKTKGFSEFKQHWGERPHIKDWRRGEVVMQNYMGVADLLRDSASSDVEEQEQVVLKIPETEEEFEAAHNILALSYLSRGQDFFNELDDLEVALVYLDSLIQRFPEHYLVPEAYYYKMLVYSKNDQMRAAEQAANYLLEHYPTHELSQKILNNKKKEEVAEVQETSFYAEQYYASLYQVYSEERYEDVIQSKIDFYNKFSDASKLLPKVDFLEALSYAKTERLDEYKSALEDIMRSYPSTEEATQARIYLRVLQGVEADDEQEKEISTQPTSAYKFREGSHFVLIIPSGKGNVGIDALEAMNSLMNEHFPNARIRASNSFLDLKTPLILVKTYQNIQNAQSAVAYFQESKNMLIQTVLAGAEILLISQDNFKVLFTEKKLKEYQLFYQEHYQ